MPDQYIQHQGQPVKLGLEFRDKYQELCNFEKRGKEHFFLKNIRNIQESERVWTILNWLGWDRLRLIERNNKRYKTCAGIFEVLSNKFRPLHNETILSLYYSKLIRVKKDEEWSSHIRINQMNTVVKKKEN